MGRWVSFGAVGVLAACAGEALPEGARPGECEDGADNDANGYFDCQDRGCWGAPACQDQGGPSTDTDATVGPDDDDDDDDNGADEDDTDAGSEDDEDDTDVPDEDAALAPHLRAVSIRFEQRFRIGGANGPALCNSGILPECDCSGVWEGDGVLIDAEVHRNRYDGHWRRIADDCDPIDDQGTTYTSAVWTPDDEVTYHTIRFDWDTRNNVNRGVLEWIAHLREADDTPSQNPSRDSQFWMIPDHKTGFDDATLTVLYEEHRVSSQGPGVDLILDSKLTMFFSDDGTPPALPPLGGP